MPNDKKSAQGTAAPEPQPQATEQPKPTPQPTTPGQRLMADVPTRRFRPLIWSFVIMFVLAFGAGGWYYFTALNSKTPTTTPVVVEPEVEEQPQKNQDYFGATFDTEGKSVVYGINPDTGDVREVAKPDSNYAPVVAVTDTGVYYINTSKGNINRNNDQLSKYDRETKKTTVVAKVSAINAFFQNGRLSPDGTAIALAEICSYDCVKGVDEELRQSIVKFYTIDPTTDKIKVILEKKFFGEFPYGLRSWANNNTLSLFRYCECDGVDVNGIELMDAKTGDVIKVSPNDAGLETLALSPDGTKVVYTYITVEAGDNPQKFTSGIKIKDLSSGKVETVAEETTQAFQSVGWISDERIVFVHIPKVASLNPGLGGYFPDGEQFVASIDVSKSDYAIDTYSDPEKYVIIAKVTPEYVFYTSLNQGAPPAPQPIKNFVYNVKTGKTVEIKVPKGEQLTY